MFTFLLVVQAIIAASLVGVILMQRSEGGGLGMGGSPSGLMSARGAADFLTRATAVLATLFVVMSIALAAYASVSRAPSTIDTSLARPAAAPMAPVGSNPLGAIPGPGPLGGAPGVPAPELSLPAPADKTPQVPPAPSGSTASSSEGKLSSSEKVERSKTTSTEQAGSAKAGTTPMADVRPEKAPKAPAASTLDIVPLRQTPKVGTLATSPPATTPAPDTSAPAPAGGAGNSSQP